MYRLIYLAIACWFLPLVSLFGSDPSLYLGLLIQNQEAMIPHFLKRVERFEYDKKEIYLQVDIANENPAVQEIVKKWCDANQSQYKGVSCRVTGQSEAQIKASYLRESGNCTFLCILPSDVFLQPFTLRYLTKKELPIVSPLLRPAPGQCTLLRNFFLKATPEGYFQEDPGYNDIALRMHTGTFPVDCVHKAYLIQTQYCDSLSFGEEALCDFIAFSNQARAEGVPQYLCTEREFGSFILNHSDHQDLFVPSLAQQVDLEKLQKIVSGYPETSSLKEYLHSFPVELYSIYQVRDDLFWVEEKWDLIKSCWIKEGFIWEPHIHELISQYVTEGTVALDLGGHIGTHTIALSHAVGPTGSVHVFEPQKKLFTELLVNATLSGCKNIYPHLCAIGDVEGVVEIVNNDFRNEGAAHLGSGGDLIPMRTLDSFDLPPISFIKIDIEGYEFEALKGGLKTILRDKPVMIVEVFDRPEREEKLNFIRSLGYDLTHLIRDDYLCLPNGDLQ